MYVRVEARPGAKRESVIETGDRTYTVAVKEPAERGLANKRIREIVAEFLGVPAGKLKLVSGHRSPRKIYSVD
jgi:uncharacterized protein